jgi:hypothetical protein
MQSTERRYLKTELRAEPGDNGRPVIKGYAAKFNTLSEDMGGFRETILPGAFDLERSTDIIFNFEHSDPLIMGRSTSGTLRVAVDDIGLAFECEAPNTTLGNDIVELIKRGDISGCSFAFIVDESGEQWDTTDDDTPLRKLTKGITVFDVCVCVHPAYQDTEVALRSLSNQRATLLQLCHARLRLAQLHI